MFYEYRQNNSGGSFDVDHAAGISVHVIVEADSADSANTRAEEIGLYFDGCETGQDCSCCGDRWYAVWQDDGDEEPTRYGAPLDTPEGRTLGQFGIKWVDGNDAYVHYLDGRVEGIEFEKEVSDGN